MNTAFRTCAAIGAIVLGSLTVGCTSTPIPDAVDAGVEPLDFASAGSQPGGASGLAMITPPPADLAMPASAIALVAGVPGGSGHADGLGSDVRFHFPWRIAADGAGNLYVLEYASRVLRKIDPTGAVTTIAGRPYPVAHAAVYQDGVGSQATFMRVRGLVVDPTCVADCTLYVLDSGAIRAITQPGNVVSTLVPSTALTSSPPTYSEPAGLARDATGAFYVTDSAENLVRRVSPTGVVTIASPLGVLKQPIGIAVDAQGNLYVADSGHGVVRKIAPDATTIYPHAGAKVDPYPVSVTIDASGRVFAASGVSIYELSTTAGVVQLAGSGSYGYADGTSAAASFNNMNGITFIGADLFVADTTNNVVRKVTAAGVVTTIAGRAGKAGNTDGPAASATFTDPSHVTSDASGNIYVSDLDANTIRLITPAGDVSTLAGLAPHQGSADGVGSAARFDSPSGIALDSSGNLFVADWHNHTIRKIAPGGVVTTFAGTAVSGIPSPVDGTGAAARFSHPRGLTIDHANNLYVSDGLRIRRVTPSAVVTTVFTNCYPCTLLACDPAGNVVTHRNDELVRIDPQTGAVTSLASVPDLFVPSVTVDAAGKIYFASYAADGEYGKRYAHSLIYRLDPGGVVTPIAGQSGAWGLRLGALPGLFNAITNLHATAQGDLIVLDNSEHAVLRIRLP